MKFSDQSLKIGLNNKKASLTKHGHLFAAYYYIC